MQCVSTENKYAKIGLKALQRAAAKVAEDARKNKHKIPVWRDGHIEFVIPGAITEQLHSPDGKKRGGADAASLGGPLVMRVVRLKNYGNRQSIKAIGSKCT